MICLWTETDGSPRREGRLGIGGIFIIDVDGLGGCSNVRIRNIDRLERTCIQLRPRCRGTESFDMSSNTPSQTLSLASGRQYELTAIRNDLIPNYYLLAFPIEQGQPSASEVTEMLNHGIRHAQDLARDVLGDSDAFTILYSGYSARREKGWHVHIVLLGSRWRKAWLYCVLAGKNLLQAIGLRRDDAPRT